MKIELIRFLHINLSLAMEIEALKPREIDHTLIMHTDLEQYAQVYAFSKHYWVYLIFGRLGFNSMYVNFNGSGRQLDEKVS